MFCWLSFAGLFESEKLQLCELLSLGNATPHLAVISQYLLIIPCCHTPTWEAQLVYPSSVYKVWHCHNFTADYQELKKNEVGFRFSRVSLFGMPHVVMASRRLCSGCPGTDIMHGRAGRGAPSDGAERRYPSGRMLPSLPSMGVSKTRRSVRTKDEGTSSTACL